MIPEDVIINIFLFMGIGRRRGHCVAYTRSYRVCRKKVPQHRALCSHHCKTFVPAGGMCKIWKTRGSLPLEHPNTQV